MRLATLSDGTSEILCAEKDGHWQAVAASEPSGAEAVLAALADPGGVATDGRPVDAGVFAPVMPFRPRRDVFCLGKNYRAHAEEFSRYSGDREVVPAAPVVFTKSAGALCGPTDDITVPANLAGSVDYEAELVVVIGRPGASVGPERALSHVAGYSVLNDTTARDLQSLHAQWYLGKSIPAATPWGPVVVTPDELEPFAERAISATVNGEQRQQARLGQMIFNVADAIAAISRVVPLEAGDLIAMGTPSGVGVGFDPPRFLKDGDLVTCRVEGIGELRNRIRIEQRSIVDAVSAGSHAVSGSV